MKMAWKTAEKAVKRRLEKHEDESDEGDEEDPLGKEIWAEINKGFRAQCGLVLPGSWRGKDNMVNRLHRGFKRPKHVREEVIIIKTIEQSQQEKSQKKSRGSTSWRWLW